MRVLLIEDEEKVQRFVKRGLQAEHFAVDTCSDGKEGLETASLCEYDLIILDLMLPGIDGTELLKRLRAINKQVPILILTAKDSLQDKVKHFEAGADDYLTKPFAFSELIVRIKALLRRGPAPRSNILKIADLEIDRMAHQVRRNTQTIKLTSKEYSLLEYLALNKGRVLSRTMIIEHVWDQSFEGFTNIVDVYVRQLREKIDENHSLKLIKTVRNVGYQMMDEVG
ncbi:MAG: response regulator transcription factor [Verrucomicrobiota bacterium]